MGRRLATALARVTTPIPSLGEKGTAAKPVRRAAGSPGCRGAPLQEAARGPRALAAESRAARSGRRGSCPPLQEAAGMLPREGSGLCRTPAATTDRYCCIQVQSKMDLFFL